MHSISHIPSQYPNADIQVFVSKIPYVGARNYLGYWTKPAGKTMGHILCVGAGGNGGAGLVGANSLAGGGGGGGSGGQTSIRFPLWAVPDNLFIHFGAGGATSRIRVQVGEFDDGATNLQNTLCAAGSGAAGGNGTAVPAGGAGGAGGAVLTAGGMSLGWQWLQQSLAGQGGSVGGTTGNGTGVSLPTTGLLVTAGGGGAGLPAAGAAGGNGGTINSGGVFAGIPTGPGGSSATLPPAFGSDGFLPISNLLYQYGGTGGGATHGSATGAGAVQAPGGNGAWGCGGGGSGAALTGSTAGVPGKGGPAFCIITCW